MSVILQFILYGKYVIDFVSVCFIAWQRVYIAVWRGVARRAVLAVYLYIVCRSSRKLTNNVNFCMYAGAPFFGFVLYKNCEARVLNCGPRWIESMLNAHTSHFFYNEVLKLCICLASRAAYILWPCVHCALTWVDNIYLFIYCDVYNHGQTFYIYCHLDAVPCKTMRKTYTRRPIWK